MASSIGESITFLCERVYLDGERLLPLDPDVDFVFLRISVNTQKIQIVYKNSVDPLAEELEVIFKWEHVLNTSTVKDGKENLVIFELDKNVCGYSSCNLIVSNIAYERLGAIIEIMYFNMLRTRYGYIEGNVCPNVPGVYVLEDKGFGLEEDLIAAAKNASTSQSSSTANEEEKSSQSSVPEGASQTVTEEKVTENAPEIVTETEPIVQQSSDEEDIEDDVPDANDSLTIDEILDDNVYFELDEKDISVNVIDDEDDVEGNN